MEGKYTILDKKWPLITLSTTPSIYDFEEDVSSVNITGPNYDLKNLVDEDKMFEFCYVDVFKKSVSSKNATKEQFEDFIFTLRDYKIINTGNNTDVTEKYSLNVDKKGIVSVEVLGAYEIMNPTDLANLTIDVVYNNVKNFLTNEPVKKTIVVQMTLGEEIDFSKQYNIRFVDHLGKEITDEYGNSLSLKLYGNELPIDAPTRLEAQKYLDANYIDDKIRVVGDHLYDMWLDEDGKTIRPVKAKEDAVYYLNTYVGARLVRYLYFDYKLNKVNHFDLYYIPGKEYKIPDINDFSSDTNKILKWSTTPDTASKHLRITDNIDSIDFLDSYEGYKVQKGSYSLIYAEYEKPFSTINWKVDGETVATSDLKFGYHIDDLYEYSSFPAFTQTNYYDYHVDDWITVPKKQYHYCKDKMYEVDFNNLNFIKDDENYKEINETGVIKLSYDINLPVNLANYNNKN